MDARLRVGRHPDLRPSSPGALVVEQQTLLQERHGLELKYAGGSEFEPRRVLLAMLPPRRHPILPGVELRFIYRCLKLPATTS